MVCFMVSICITLRSVLRSRCEHEQVCITSFEVRCEGRLKDVYTIGCVIVMTCVMDWLGSHGVDDGCVYGKQQDATFIHPFT